MGRSQGTTAFAASPIRRLARDQQGIDPVASHELVDQLDRRRAQQGEGGSGLLELARFGGFENDGFVQLAVCLQELHATQRLAVVARRTLDLKLARDLVERL